MCIAAQNGHLKAARVLLENGARTEVFLNAKTTPLDSAISRSDKEMAQLLLHYGAQLNPQAKGKELEVPEQEVEKKVRDGTDVIHASLYFVGKYSISQDDKVSNA